MKKFISIFHIIMGSIVVYLSILFLAVAMDSPFLAVVGLAIAPASIIYFNKKFTIKAPRYYLTLFGIMLVAIVASAIIMPTDVNTSNQQEIAIKNKDEVTKTEEDSKAQDNSKDDKTKENSTDTKEDIFEGYRLIEVDGGNYQDIESLML